MTKIEEGTFFGELVVRQGDEQLKIDCRPSDGIAMAVRQGLRVYVDDSLDTRFAAA